MLKQLLIKCAELTNRDDIVQSLKKVNLVEEIENKTIQNDIYRLISYYNFVVVNLYENYLILTYIEKLSSNENLEIFYDDFKFKPIKIKSVKNSFGENINYNIHPLNIIVSNQSTEYCIEYDYIPNELTDLTDEVQLPAYLNQKVICYGVVSEFLASKDQFDKSEFWKNKFLYEVFKIRIKKERRLRPTF